MALPQSLEPISNAVHNTKLRYDGTYRDAKRGSRGIYDLPRLDPRKRKPSDCSDDANAHP